MSSTGDKGSQKANKKTKKWVQQREQGITEGCPGLAHRTVRCATGQCPVHQGTRRPILHLRENAEALHYNSPGAPEESDSELASFGFLLRYNSLDMSDAHRTVR
jgi:hypothetical protein